eukprot:GDKJ01011924.1.p1 GENE.GDKJ01011924.1~~GDKJ01011924.1.p1  ORF type:complete len:297 (-),score=67.57 GDKJ01011924.1:143-1033(-)
MTATLRGSESLQTIRNMALNSSSFRDVQIAENMRAREVISTANVAFHKGLNDKILQAKQNMQLSKRKPGSAMMRPASASAANRREASIGRSQSAIVINHQNEDEIMKFLLKRNRPDSAILSRYQPLDPLSYAGSALKTREEVTDELSKKESIRYSQRLFSRLSTKELIAANLLAKPLNGISTVHTATTKLETLKRIKADQKKEEYQAELMTRRNPYTRPSSAVAGLNRNQSQERFVMPPEIKELERKQKAEWNALERVSGSAGGLGRFGWEFAAYVQDGARIDTENENRSSRIRRK